MKWLWIIPLMVIGFAPVAFGQVVETKGQNYDLIEDFFIGEAKWTSHPERIMVNGEWENYFLETSEQKIIFRSNNVGGFIYDIPTCSYTIYETGFDGEQIIPSVSSVATYLKDGTWQNMAVNEESCDVNFSQNENGIFLTSTKILTQTINNGTNLNGTAITFDVETERFTQEIKVDINSGIKETFKVWNEGNEQLGISQTVHTGESITVGGQTIDIASFNGQSFDRQFLEDNESEIFEVAQGLNYDFDLGFDSLSGLNIYHDTDYKVNLDYANGNFVNYLEIDPTFTQSTTSDRHAVGSNGSGCSNPSSGTITDHSAELFLSSVYQTSVYNKCHRSYTEFDISSIPNNAIVTDSYVTMLVSSATNVGSDSLDVYSMSSQGSTISSFTTLYQAIATGTQLLDADTTMMSVGTHNLDLSSAGDSEIQTLRGNNQGWLSIGYKMDSEVTGSSWRGIDVSPSEESGQDPTLTVVYSVPTIPQPPTNLSATTGIPIELSWSAPVDDGGSSITGYKVFRTDNEFSLTDLPDNSGSDSQIDFTNNEFLVHGDSLTDSSTNAISITGTGSSISGTIGNAIDSPDLSYTDSNLPDNTDNFSVGGWVTQTMGSTPTSYSQTSTDDQQRLGSGGGSGSRKAVGVEINSGSTLVGEKISSFTLYKHSNSSPSGTVTAYVYDSSGTVVATSTNTHPATWTGSATWNFDGTYTLQTDDKLVIYYWGGGYFSLSRNNGGGFDGNDSEMAYLDSSDNWQVISFDLKMDISTLVPQPPTNTKLLGLNDVSFNVGTTSASVENTVTSTTIISATGLTNNTSTPQHYTFTRDGNDWTIYQNGVSEATATDTTSLGSNVGNNYTTKLDGSLDEFFINSDVLTASEISDIYNRGIAPTQIATPTSTTFDDGTATGGNTYYYSVQAVNSIGDSNYLTPFVSGLAGTPPNPPTGLTSTIQDVNANPLDIYLQWSSPTNVGSGTLTGFEIWRDGALITTTGLVTSYTDTVSSSGTYSYQVKAVSTHGTSGFSNSSNQTTPTVPNAITDLSATVDSDTQISLSWSAPTNGGSAITGYKVFQDGVQIATPTSANYVVTGLTSNTQYTFKVIAVNNVGDSADSNLVTPTTYETITGSINVSSTVQGATVKFDFVANVTSGTPTPNFNTFTLKEGTTTIASNISSPYYLAIPDGASHSYTITSTDNAHWNTPTISGTASNIVAGYAPNWENSVAYNYTRTSNTMSLAVNQNTQSLWTLNCNYQTTAQVMSKNGGTWGNMTSANWYYTDAQSISDADTVYVECIDETGMILSFTSYNTNRIGAGIALLDNVFSEWTGTPVALVFVLLVAGLFSGRSAPAGILLVLAIVGVMGFIGLLVIDELIWAFILLAGILGLFMGKRFL